MELRCKVFRALDAATLESSINAFFADLGRPGELQIEEITQSEGPSGVTVTLWYSLLEQDEDLVDEYEGEHPNGELA